MKIKALKNLIVFGAFAFMLFNHSNVFAFVLDTGMPAEKPVVKQTTPTENVTAVKPNTPVAEATKEISENNLTALSLNGSGSFMPSSIWQWLLVIILILAIIIISRLFVKKPEPGHH